MEVIITDKNRVDIGSVEEYANIDADINKKRTITVQIARAYYDSAFSFGSWIYIPGTEYGGMIDRVNTTTALDYVELSADTCRGKLAKRIIEPPYNQTHLVMSGDIHDIMRKMVNHRFDGLINVVSYNAGKSLNNYTFDRYDTLLDGIEKMLKSVSYKLVARIVRSKTERVHFEIFAEPITDYSKKIQISNDNKLTFTMEEQRNGYNHIIALGKGEGLDRVVLHKYIGANGEVTNTQYYTGYQENVYLYENTNAESAELEKKTIEKLRDLASKKTLGMSAITLSSDIKIGDIVGGKDEVTGLYNSKPVENIICKIRDGKANLSYKLEGES